MRRVGRAEMAAPSWSRRVGRAEMGVSGFSRRGSNPAGVIFFSFRQTPGPGVFGDGEFNGDNGFSKFRAPRAIGHAHSGFKLAGPGF